MFLFFVNSFPSAEIVSKSGRHLKIQMMPIAAFPNDLNPHCKNVYHYVNNFFNELFYFFDIPRRYRLVCSQTTSLDRSLYFLLLFSFFSKLGSSVLIMHISEIFLLIILINHVITWNTLNSHQLHILNISFLPYPLRLLILVTYSP